MIVEIKIPIDPTIKPDKVIQVCHQAGCTAHKTPEGWIISADQAIKIFYLGMEFNRKVRE